MPGYILHLTAARMLLDTLPENNPLRIRTDLQNDFYIGNLLPDAVSNKTQSHFRDSRYLDRMIVWPRPEEFCRKYKVHMHEPVYFGYYFHLYIDKAFFSSYLPQVAEFLDKDGQPTELRRGVCSVRLKRTGQLITLDQYLSEEYYYGDYTKMNTWLCERYHLPEHLYTGRDPGIEEVDYSEMNRILTLLKEYRNIPAEAVQDVRVFTPERLINFLEKSVQNAKIPPLLY